jgi:WD40 repeat protein
MGIDEPRKSTQSGSGPVAFREADGAALQFVPDLTDRFTLRLWNIDRQERVREFKLADKPSPPGWHQRNHLTLALCADGSQVAASTVNDSEGTGTLMVWDVSLGKPIRTIPKGFRALAFTPDGSLLAGGDREGIVTIWSQKQEKERAVLPVGHTAVLGLAFSRDPHRRPARQFEDGWLLAVGDAGSNATIWDLGQKKLRTSCQGSFYRVHAVAFSPDGTVLASTGRNYETKLWDAATGQLLLNLVTRGRNWMTGLAYSSDGTRLAISSATAFPNNPGGVDVWQLEYGRGIQTLRGLSTRAAQVTMSPDDRLLATLDDDWRVGIWELPSGRLLHVLEVPPGYYTDNAALAFSPNGDRFAFASGSSARLWDVATGREISSWRLPPGMNDHMAFDPVGKRLLLVRKETKKRELPPLDRAPWQKHLRVVRGYDLLGPVPTRAFVDIKDFQSGAVVDLVSPDASYFVVRGVPDPLQPLRCTIKVLDGLTGRKELLSFVETVSTPDSNLGLCLSDPTGQLLLLELVEGNRKTFELFAMPAGKLVRSLPAYDMPSAGAKLWSVYSPRRDPDAAPFVRLNHDARASTGGPFNIKGTHLTWGNVDGTVTVCDLEEIQRRLAVIGLGW